MHLLSIMVGPLENAKQMNMYKITEGYCNINIYSNI